MGIPLKQQIIPLKFPSIKNSNTLIVTWRMFFTRGTLTSNNTNRLKFALQILQQGCLYKLSCSILALTNRVPTFRLSVDKVCLKMKWKRRSNLTTHALTIIDNRWLTSINNSKHKTWEKQMKLMWILFKKQINVISNLL